MKKFLSLVLALVMTMSLVTISAGAKDFTDDSKITYEEAVDVVSTVKIVGGYEDGSFKPNATLTRGAAAKIICNLILGPTTAGALVADAAPYKDVPANSTFAGYIAFCQKEGIISGYADGTFKPGNTLTGYAFMKMLLGALGYDQDVEGYTGANWSINVAKRAIAIGLDDDLVDDFNGVKAVTREEACLFAFNALQAKPVTYPNSSTIVVGDITVQSNAKATESANKYYVTLFDGKLVENDDTDVYGRPATKWTYKKAEIGTYGKEADAVFTDNAKLYTVSKELGMDSGDQAFFYYTMSASKTYDGITGAAVGNRAQVDYYQSSSSVKLDDIPQLNGYMGNGVTVEFFYEDEVSHKNNKIIVIDEYIGEVNKVDTDDDGRFITIKNEGSRKFYTEEFAKGDMVLFTIGNDTNEFASVKAAEKLTGKLDTIKGSDLIIDGTKYSLHGGMNKATNSANPGDEVDFYLDSAGYIIKVDVTKAGAAMENLGIIIDKRVSGWDTLGKVVYGTGKMETVTLKDSATAVDNVYSLSTSSNKLKVSDMAGYTSYYAPSGSGAYYFTKGATKITNAANNAGTTIVAVDNNTNFVFIDLGDDTATAYTGYKNAPAFAEADALVYLMKSGAKAAAVVFVYVDSNDVTYKTSDLVYAIADSYKLVKTNNEKGDRIEYYDVNTLDGQTIKFKPTTFTDLETYKNAGVVVYSAMTKDEDGIVTSATKKADKITYYMNTVTVEEDDGVIYFDGINGVSYASDVTVYELAKDASSFEKIEIDGIDQSYAGYTYVVNDDGLVTTLVLKKA